MLLVKSSWIDSKCLLIFWPALVAILQFGFLPCAKWTYLMILLLLLSFFRTWLDGQCPLYYPSIRYCTFGLSLLMYLIKNSFLWFMAVNIWSCVRQNALTFIFAIFFWLISCFVHFLTCKGWIVTSKVNNVLQYHRYFRSCVHKLQLPISFLHKLKIFPSFAERTKKEKQSERFKAQFLQSARDFNV